MSDSLVERGTELIELHELHSRLRNIVAPVELFIFGASLIVFFMCAIKRDYSTMPGRFYRWILLVDFVSSFVISLLRWYDKDAEVYKSFAYSEDQNVDVDCKIVVFVDTFLHIMTVFINTMIVYAMFYNVYWKKQFAEASRAKMVLWSLIVVFLLPFLVAVVSVFGDMDNKVGWCVGSSTLMVFKQFTWFILFIIQVILIIPTTLLIWRGARLVKMDGDGKMTGRDQGNSTGNFSSGAYIRYYGIIIAELIGLLPLFCVEYMALVRKPVGKNLMILAVYGIPAGHFIRLFTVCTKFIPNILDRLGRGICKSAFQNYKFCRGYTEEGLRLDIEERKNKEKEQGESTSIWRRLPFWFQLSWTLLIPFILLLATSINMINNINGVQTKAENIQSDIFLTISISDYIHETQKERGATGVFMGSGGERFDEELLAQTKLTNRLKGDLSYFLDNDFTNVRLVSKSIFIESLMYMLQIEPHRVAVRAFAITKGEGIGFYTTMNMNFLGIVGLVARDADLGDIQQLMYSFLAYTHSKEKAGNERALGSTPFAKKVWNPTSYSKFVKVIAMQDTHDYFFETFATPENIQFRDYTMLQDKCVQVHYMMRKLALDDLTPEEYEPYTGSMWFHNETCKIDLQRIVEDNIAQELQSEAQAIVDSSTSGMIVVVATLAVVLVSNGMSVMGIAATTQQLESFSTAAKKKKIFEEKLKERAEKFYSFLRKYLTLTPTQSRQHKTTFMNVMRQIEETKNMAFLTQVYLSVFLCAASLVIFSWILLEENITHSRRAAQLWENSNLSFFLSNTVHETQKERGATGVFMNSGGVNFEVELPAQRLGTNHHARVLYQFLHNDFIDYMGIQERKSMMSVMAGLAELNEHRLRIWRFEYTPAVGIGWYTTFNMKIISVLDDVAKDASGDNIEPRVLSYLGFMYAKEKAGNERAVGTLGLSNGMWPTVQDVAKFTSLVNFQTAAMNYFFVFGNAKSKSDYQEKLISPTKETHPVVIANAYQKAMLDHNKTLMTLYTAVDWFGNITLKINKLREVEQTIAYDMNDFFDRFTVTYWQKIIFVLAVVCITAVVTLWIMLKGFALIMRSNSFYSYRNRLDKQLNRYRQMLLDKQKVIGTDQLSSDSEEVDAKDINVTENWD